MDFINQLHIWAKGDTTQGRWMVGVAIVLLLPFLIIIIRSNNSLLRGMLIPICLLLIMNLGYGGYLLLAKQKVIDQTEVQFREKPEETLKSEFARVKAEDKSYIFLKSVWTMLVVLSIVLYFIFTNYYYKGLALGLIGTFFGMLLIDTFLHHRLNQYLNALQDPGNNMELSK